MTTRRHSPELPPELLQSSHLIAAMHRPSRTSVHIRLTRVLPVFVWGRSYSFSDNFVNDLLAGLTVSTLVIPQGMAYAVTTSLPPVYGLYTSIFPPLVFFFFARSPYQNIGPTAVVSVMVSQVCTSAMTWLKEQNLLSLQASGTEALAQTVLKTEYAEVVMLVTFLVGIVQFTVCSLGLGARLVTLIPDSLVSGFMASSGICVLVIQLKAIFGIAVQQFDGSFSLILTLFDIIKKLPTTNLCSFGLAVLAYIFMLAIQRLERYLSVHIPRWISNTRSVSSYVSLDSESIIPKKPPAPVTDVILTVLLVAFITIFFDLPNTFGVETIGPIPSGFPTPTLPWAMLTRLPLKTVAKLILKILPDCISLALICFVTTFSISKTFESTTHTPDHASANDHSQDLVAVSFATIGSSFLSAYIPCGSISRGALLATQTNVTSPVGSLVSVFCVSIILLFLGSWFQNVPLSSLGTIVVVALFGVLAKIQTGFALIQDAREQRRVVGEEIVAVKHDLLRRSACADGETRWLLDAEVEDQRTVQIDQADLWLLRRKFVGLHREVVVWWVTFLTVIFVDAGSGILVGMVVSCLFILVAQ